jgi:hypothetical protein
LSTKVAQLAVNNKDVYIEQKIAKLNEVPRFSGAELFTVV